MKLLYNILAFLFCVLTLGLVDLEIKYSDGSSFSHKSWIRLFWKKDVVPIKHGEWKTVQKTNEYSICQCSVCLWFATDEYYPYCPHCGARMDGGKEYV